VEEKKVGLSLRAVSGHEASREHVEKYKAESQPALGHGDRGSIH
jgi:hypothetical protein